MSQKKTAKKEKTLEKFVFPDHGTIEAKNMEEAQKKFLSSKK
jgi:hypothetical protein